MFTDTLDLPSALGGQEVLTKKPAAAILWNAPDVFSASPPIFAARQPACRPHSSGWLGKMARQGSGRRILPTPPTITTDITGGLFM
jgi:hypothetical protein